MASSHSLSTFVITFVGDDCVEATPVPIPNTAVKLYSADGTAGVARWESTTLPALYWEAPGPRVLGLSLFVVGVTDQERSVHEGQNEAAEKSSETHCRPLVHESFLPPVEYSNPSLE